MLGSLAALVATTLIATCDEPKFIPHDGAVRVSATDLTMASGSLTLRRAYTSSLKFVGQFGRGFGIEEELQVTRLPSGALRVILPGPCPACASAIPAASPDALARSVELAARTLRASGVAALAAEATAYARALAESPEFRQAEWEAQREAWLAEARQEPADGLERLPMAARYRVVALPSGYLRFADPTQVQELDAQGRLTQVLSAAGLVKKVSRDAAGRITRIEDGRGHAIALTLDAAGLVTRATSSDGVSSTYGYDAAGRLAWSDGTDGRAAYSWSAQDQLTGLENRIRRTTITYESPSAGGRVIEIDDPSLGHERYVYAGAPGGISRSVTVYEVTTPEERTDNGEDTREATGEDDVAAPDEDADDDEEDLSQEPAEAAEDGDDETDPDDAGAASPASPDITFPAAPSELRRYSYVEPLTQDGRRWTWQETIEEGDEVTATTYDDATFQPLVIATGDRVTRFVYDDLGRVVRKTSAVEETALTYGENGKVATASKGPRVPSVESPRVDYSFGYDASGRLTSARGGGRSAEIEYDGRGRITILQVTSDGNTRRLYFTYGENDRPSRIAAAGVGEITISYRPEGDIEKVDSAGGRKIALEVTSSFQVMLELIRAAGT